MLARALIGIFFYEKEMDGSQRWFIEMVQADVIVGEISCQQKFFLQHFSSKTQL